MKVVQNKPVPYSAPTTYCDKYGVLVVAVWSGSPSFRRANLKKYCKTVDINSVAGDDTMYHSRRCFFYRKYSDMSLMPLAQVGDMYYLQHISVSRVHCVSVSGTFCISQVDKKAELQCRVFLQCARKILFMYCIVLEIIHSWIYK